MTLEHRPFDDFQWDRASEGTGRFGRLWRGYTLHRLLFYRQQGLRKLSDLLSIKDPLLAPSFRSREEGRVESAVPFSLSLLTLKNGTAVFRRLPEGEPRTAWDWLTRGIAAESHKDFHEAIRSFTRALDLRPGWAWAHVWRGVARWYHSPPANSVEDFQAALRADPDFTFARVLLGRSWADLRDKRMIPDLSAALKAAPRSGLTYAWRGRAYTMIGKEKEAAADLTRAIALSPDYDRGPSWRGVLRVRQERHAAALPDLRRAGALNGGYATTFYHQAHAALETGRFDEALKGMRRAAAIDTQDLWVEFFTDFQNPNPAFARSLEDLERLIEKRPRLAWLWAWKGQTLLVLKRYRDAVEALDRALALKPADGWARAWRGEALRRLGLIGRAQKDFEASKEAWAFAGLGYCRLYRGQWAAARRALDRALALNPRCGRGAAHVWRAEASSRLGDRERAAADLARGLEFYPRWDWVQRRRRWLDGETPVASHAGLPALPRTEPRLREVEAAMTRELGKQPFDRKLYLRRGAARIGLGDAAGAAEDASLALDMNLDPDDADAILLRAKARAGQGDAVAAGDDLRRLQTLYGTR